MKNFIEIEQIGDYQVHFPGQCNCEIKFAIQQGKLVELTDNNVCWEAPMLYKGERQIAINFFNKKVKFVDEKVNPNQIEKSVLKRFLPQKLNNSNETKRHRHIRKHALVEWLLTNNFKPELKIDNSVVRKSTLTLEKNLSGNRLSRQKAEIWAEMYLIKSDKEKKLDIHFCENSVEHPIKPAVMEKTDNFPVFKRYVPVRSPGI